MLGIVIRTIIMLSKEKVEHGNIALVKYVDILFLTLAPKGSVSSVWEGWGGQRQEGD